jgi:hypothetical protein
MTARCRDCGRYWIVSILKQIPKSGYVCPRCSDRDRLIRVGILKRRRKP